MLDYKTPAFNEIVWGRFLVDKMRPLDKYFPMELKPILFKVRHSRDPLMVALNLTIPGDLKLDFGADASQLKQQGITGVVLFGAI